jgi:adenine phosphoribosyltransferase
MTKQPATYRIELGGITRDLRLFEVAPGVRIAILNILGDTELVQAASRLLAEKLHHLEYGAFITAAAKSIPLVHQLSLDTGKPYIVLRKTLKSYMGDAILAETESITTGAKQTLYLDEKDHPLVNGQSVVIVDDVISTGSTLNGIREIVSKASGSIAAEAAIFTEGDAEKWKHIIALGNLPVWIDE